MKPTEEAEVLFYKANEEFNRYAAKNTLKDMEWNVDTGLAHMAAGLTWLCIEVARPISGWMSLHAKIDRLNGQIH